MTNTSARILTSGAQAARALAISAARPTIGPWSVNMVPDSTFTLTNAAPVATATASAARASLRRTLTPTGSPAPATAATQRVIAATVTLGTSSAKNGASPKFSTAMASNPAPASAWASAAAAATTASRSPEWPGDPGNAPR